MFPDIFSCMESLLSAILNTFATVLFAPFVIVWFTIIVKKDSPIIALKNLSIYALIYVVMMSPWWLHNYNKHHEFVHLNLSFGAILYSGNNEINTTGGGIGGLDYSIIATDTEIADFCKQLGIEQPFN